MLFDFTSSALVNPQAINQDFDVLTTNVRSVLYLTHTPTGKQMAFVAVGALLVGSVLWTKGAEKGSAVRRGEELGYFAYGGSTIVVLFPQGCIDFDEDLLNNSKMSLETLVKACVDPSVDFGESILTCLVGWGFYRESAGVLDPLNVEFNVFSLRRG
ncbi:hypothetical protein PM082_010350 [Marasmius tenuissimus]|nr:hypothetical protein PM082_010350 [Marasmius tenuissimus]